MEQTAFCYKTGDYYIMLEAGIRSEILASPSVYPVPFAPEWCLGLAGVRGELFPVLDMRRVLLNQQQQHQPYLLWLEHEQFKPIIIGSDDLPVQVDIDNSINSSERIPGLPGWIRSAWRDGDKHYLEADHGRLFRTLLGNQKR